MRKLFPSFSNLTLLVALSLSTVAAYYSIIGLTAIFAGAVIPVIIMGSILEVGKITTTVWLRKYWSRASWVLKLYLVPAVIALALLTSMGIFGFLSKAHMDQGIVSGDALAKVAIFDEKIKTAKDNIDGNRKVLKQMDESVDQIMGRSTSETGADKAVAVRKSQQKERARIIAEIQAEQATISKLSEDRAPLASEVRKVEAEVGPIKYIAALIYGDNADSNMLEAAVRWVIILLVVVFDPLAIALVLAANASKEWDNEETPAPAYIADVTMPEPIVEDTIEIVETAVTEEPVVEKTLLELHPYLTKGFVHFEGLKPIVGKVEPIIEPIVEPTVVEEITEEVAPEIDADNQEFIAPPKPYEELEGGYVIHDGLHVHLDALKSMRPDIFMLNSASNKPISTNFGIKFPDAAEKGDVFVRVDMLPNKVFKYLNGRWTEVNKDQSDSYLYNQKYVQYLVNKIDKGEYDVDLLNDNEKEQIEAYLKNQKT